MHPRPHSGESAFQFLIGSLEVTSTLSAWNLISMFQFLIGSLEVFVS